MKIEKLLAVLIAVVPVLVISLLLSGAIWWLWCWVMPQLWATGPQNLVQPPFWLFYATIFLVNIVRNWLKPEKQ